MSNRKLKVLTGIVLAILISSTFLALVGHGNDVGSSEDIYSSEQNKDEDKISNEDQRSVDPNEELENVKKNLVSNVENVDWKSKLSPDIKGEVLGTPKKTTVMVTTSNLGELYSVLKKVGGVVNVDSSKVNDEQFDYSTLDYNAMVSSPVTREVVIHSSYLDEIAKLGCVYSVFKKPEIKKHGSAIMPDALGNMEYGSGLGPYYKGVNSSLAKNHNAYEAWEEGYDGTGVNIAIVDTGTDFSHADLVNQWAVAPEGDFSGAGWPIMFNPGSMEMYLTRNKTDLNRTIYGGYPVGYEDGSDSAYSQTNFTFNPTDDPIKVENETVIPKFSEIDFEESERSNFIYDLKGDGIYPDNFDYTGNITRQIIGEISSKDESNDTISDMIKTKPSTGAPKDSYRMDGMYTVDSNGTIGKHSSIAYHKETATPHICYYDELKHDLKYATINESSGEWENETIDFIGAVGKYSSIAVDSENIPHISYYDETKGDLRYATKDEDGNWEMEVVNSSGDVGKYCDIALNSEDIPSISYYDATNSALIVANLTTDGWISDIKDNSGDVGKYSSIDFDNTDKPIVSYYNETSGDLEFWGWYNKNQIWIQQKVDVDGDVGKYSEIVNNEVLNFPYISYYNSTSMDLKFARKSGDVWEIDVVDDNGDVGSFNSIDVMSDEKRAHITYYNRSSNTLKYAHWTGNDWKSGDWSSETINNADEGGLYSSLALDIDEEPQISYFDIDGNMIKFTNTTGATWDVHKIDSVDNILEKGENMCVSGFDTGNTGGVLDSLHIDLSYSVNSLASVPEWNMKNLSLLNGDNDIVDLGVKPKPGDNAISTSIDIYDIANVSYIEEIPELQVIYDINYTGQVPGPSVNFDYINIRYGYTSIDTYTKRWIENETAFLGEPSIGDTHKMRYIPKYNLTGKQIIYSNNDQPVYEVVFEGNKTDQKNDTYYFEQHHLIEGDNTPGSDFKVLYYPPGSLSYKYWHEVDTDNYTVDYINGTITLENNIENGSKVAVEYGWSYPWEGRKRLNEFIVGKDIDETNVTFDLGKHKEYVTYIEVYKDGVRWDESNYDIDYIRGNITLNTDLEKDSIIDVIFNWNFILAGREKENAINGTVEDDRNKTFKLEREYVTNVTVFYDERTMVFAKEWSEENYTIDYINGTLTIDTDIPKGSFINISYQWGYSPTGEGWDYFDREPKFNLDKTTGKVTLNAGEKDNINLTISYQGVKRWLRKYYRVNMKRGDITIKEEVEDDQAILCSYSCGDGLTLIDVEVPKKQYPENETWGQENLWAPYNITDLPYESQSGNYKFGLSKATHLADLWKQHVGMLLVDSEESGIYDQIFVDIDNDFDFGDEKPVNKSSPLAFTEIEKFKGTGAAVRDILNYDFRWMGNTAENANIGLSAGLLYWISDGKTSIPYAKRYAQHTGYKRITIPGQGNLTAFYSDWGTHGTSTASNAAGTGRSGLNNMNYMANDIGRKDAKSIYSNFNSMGTAPGAKVMGISMLGVSGGSADLSWKFAAEGYDGKPETGDEADINSNSWGSFVSNAGWSYYDRLAINITKRYPHTTIVVSAGNEGNGYRTISSPGASPAVITVGAGTNMAYEDLFGNDLDLLARREQRYPFEHGDGDPRNQHPFGDMASFSSRGPNALGQPGIDVIAAGAFGQGAMPINLMTNSPTALGVELWIQTSMMQGTTPLNNSHSSVLFSGTSLAAPVTAGVCALTYQAYESSHGRPPTMEEVKDIIMASADDHEYDPLQQGAGWVNADMAVKMACEKEGVSVEQEFWSPGDLDGQEHLAMANLMHRGESDEHMFDATCYGGSTITDVSAVKYVKDEEFTFRFDKDDVDGYINITKKGVYGRMGDSTIMLKEDTPEDTLDKMLNHTGFLKVIGTQKGATNAYIQMYNWQDANETLLDHHNEIDDGVFVNRTINGENGLYDGQGGRNERVRMTFAMNKGRFLSASIHNPGDRIHEGLRLESKTEGYEFDGNITLQTYKKVEWDWVNITDVTDSGFKANMSVPKDVGYGGYQGSILYEWDDGNTGLIPVFVNVAMNEWPVEFGDQDPNTTLYSNNRIGAHSDYYDSRIFYMDFERAGASENTHFITFLKFLSNESDMVMNLYGESFSQFRGGEYGDFSMNLVKMSEISKDPHRTMLLMSDYIQNNPKGLLMLECQVPDLGVTDEYGERINGTMGHMKIFPTEFTRYNEPVGRQEFKIQTGFNIPDGFSVISPELKNETGKEPITQHPFSGQTFVKYLAEAPTQQIIEVPNNTYTFNFHVWGLSDSDDYDLGVFLDGKGDGNSPDGKATENEFIDYCADADADEDVTVVSPEEGDYICKVAGYSVANTEGKYKYEWSMNIPGKSLFTASDVPTNTTVPQHVKFDGTFNLTWNIPEDNRTGVQEGKVFFSPQVAPTALMETLRPKVIFDERKPVVTEVVPKEGTVLNSEDVILSAQYEEKGDAGLDLSTVKIFVDGVPQLINVGDIQATCTARGLEDGVHHARVVVADNASNVFEREWSFTVKTSDPEIDMVQPEGYIATSEDTYEIIGDVKDDSNVMINSRDVNVRNGRFSHIVTLIDGMNIFDIETTDSAGNTETTQVIIEKDLDDPSLKISQPIRSTYTTKNNMLNIKGILEDNTGGQRGEVMVNGKQLEIHGDGSFATSVDLIEGLNEVEVQGTDMAGNTVTNVLRVTKDTTISDFKLDSIEKTGTNEVTVKGTVEEDSKVWINGEPVRVNSGEFEETIEIDQGTMNEIYVNAEDDAGNIGQISKSIDAVEETSSTPTENESRMSDFGGSILGFIILSIILGTILGYIALPKFLDKGDPESDSEIEFEDESEEDEEEEEYIFEEAEDVDEKEIEG